MASTIAWLDSSHEDQRRMREVIAYFSDAESRDELGIGQVRDAFSDLFFPGTSSLQTRARYLVLIPWCFRDAARLAKNSADLERRAEELERRLIPVLHAAGKSDPSAVQGLIGARALSRVRTLPSAIYWSALEQYGIRVGTAENEIAARSWDPESEEQVGRKPRMWDALPVPEHFPAAETTLALSRAEALFVKEHMLLGSRGTLLEVLLTAEDGAALLLDVPWQVPTDGGALTALQGHAHLFSHVMNGATLLYNLLLARAQDAAGLEEGEQRVQQYTDAVARWQEVHDEQLADQVDRWDLADLWTLVRVQNHRIGPATQQFVEAWVRQGSSGAIAEDRTAGELVGRRERAVKGKQSRLTNDRLLRSWSGASATRRERAVKGKQSRLTNDRLLRSWSGASATRPLLYRWQTARQLVSDVREGLGRAAS